MKKRNFFFFAPLYFSNETSEAMFCTTSQSQPDNAFTYFVGFVLAKPFSKEKSLKKIFKLVLGVDPGISF
jgi:hypothetical protein